MAKLKAPLMSLGAAGAIGKTIVFFPWKGINAAREYVIPANPKTTAQNTQRGYVTAAVANIHAVMAMAAHPLTEVDKTALSLYGSTFPTPRTWFNVAVKQWVDRVIASLLGFNMTDGVMTPGAGSIAASIWAIGDDITAGKFYYGPSKTSMVKSEVSADAAGHHTATIAGLTAGVKYYIQFVGTAPASYVGLKSGIYHATPT